MTLKSVQAMDYSQIGRYRTHQTRCLPQRLDKEQRFAPIPPSRGLQQRRQHGDHHSKRLMYANQSTQNQAFDGNIYIIRLDDRIFVKRTQWIPTGGLRIISDNPIYEPFDLDKAYLASGQFEVCGEVIEISHIIHCPFGHRWSWSANVLTSNTKHKKGSPHGLPSLKFSLKNPLFS